MRPPFTLTQGPEDQFGCRQWWLGIKVSGEQDRKYVVSDDFVRLMDEWQQWLAADTFAPDAFIPIELPGETFGVADMSGKRARLVANVIGEGEAADTIAALMSAAHAETLSSEPF